MNKTDRVREEARKKALALLSAKRVKLYRKRKRDENDMIASNEARRSLSPPSSASEEGKRKREKVLQEVYIKYADSKEQMNQLRLSRFRLERMVHLPFFSRVIRGCFVRIGIGNAHGNTVYKIAEITDVVETTKVYNLGNTRTNLGFKLLHGAQDSVLRLEFVSNQEFTDGDFETWRKAIIDAGKKPPTMDFVQNKVTEINEALKYEYKEEDVDIIVAKKERFRSYPINYAMKKAQLMKERDVAQLRGDDKTVIELNAEIQELEERASQLDKTRTSSIQSISYINKRNRKLNVEAAEKAIMEEVKAMKVQKEDDPFTRRHTRPVITFKSATQKFDNKQVEPRTEQAKCEMPTTNADADLFALHNFDVPIKIDLTPPAAIDVFPVPVPLPKPPTTSVINTGPRRAPNLDEYKKSRGLV